MIALLITIVVVLLVVGILLWGLNALPGVDPTIKQIIRVVLIVIALLWIVARVFPAIVT
jgi:hypothetical protein